MWEEAAIEDKEGTIEAMIGVTITGADINTKTKVATNHVAIIVADIGENRGGYQYRNYKDNNNEGDNDFNIN